jgi:ATP-dependent DNA helicase RecG
MKHQFIEDKLQEIQSIIAQQLPKNIENGKLELKDLSSSENWKSLHETVCAYLNTDGGFILGGIKEDNKTKLLKLTGFARSDKNRDALIGMNTLFQDEKGNLINTSEYIHFDYYPFKDKEVLAIAVESLPNDEKFVSYNGVFYERIVDTDRRISAEKLQRQKEYKEEIINRQELKIVPEASLKSLSLDKINTYVTLLTDVTQGV